MIPVLFAILVPPRFSSRPPGIIFVVQVDRGTAFPTQPSLISIDIDHMENGRPFLKRFSTSSDVVNIEDGRPFVGIIFVVQVDRRTAFPQTAKFEQH